MRPGKRPLPYAVSTVLGLVAPAAAALVLTTSVPTMAAPAPAVAAPLAYEGPRSLPRVEVAPRPTATAVPDVKPVTKRVVKAPVKRVVRTTAVEPVRRRTTARPAPKPTTVRRSTTSQTAQPAGTDDYPYRNQSDFYAMDKWGFTQRQCVSFAAWRLAQHGNGITNDGNRWGSALNWDEAARKLGRTVTRTARVGAIAQWNAGESSPYYAPGSAKANGSFSAGGYGHVGWVKKVYDDGSALVEQYNMGDSRSYSVMRVKAPRYLLV